MKRKDFNPGKFGEPDARLIKESERGKLQRLNVKINNTLYKKLKLFAVLNDITLSTLVRKSLLRFLEDQRKTSKL